MKKRKNFLFLIFSLAGFAPLFGFSFSDLNLSGDQLLFRAEFESQKTVFTARLTDLSIQQLTAFPEKLELVNNGRTIIALNHMGAARIPAAGGLPSAIPGFPSFATGRVPLKGRLETLAASADGRWILYLEPISAALGNLILVETASGAKRLISEKVELPSADFPARWSPDSRIFVYSKGKRLFYFPIIQDLDAIGDERLRQIGSGRITSVLWGQQGDFYYFLGNTLYRVLNPELFTRTIYGDFLSIGSAASSLPIDFDSDFDRFWIAPDSGSILINKRDKSLQFFLLGEDQHSASILPHVTIPQGAGNIKVLWPASPSGTKAVTVISSMQKETAVWRFEVNGKTVRTLAHAGIPSSSNGALSPDGTKAVFWGENGLELWDYAQWRPVQKLTNEPILSCLWTSNSELICGNSKFIEELAFNGAGLTRRIICLSSADEAAYEEGPRNNRILARVGSEWFATNGRTPWTLTANPQLRAISTVTERYRVYLEDTPYGLFKNMLLIRNLASTGTASIVSGHLANSAYKNGGQMKIALCFDLYDDDTGLTRVLAALRPYNIKATFFMNGDFIRRNPGTAAAIAEEGHETASLFYAPIDLSDARYRVDREFIARGLARNEDEYFRATGKELKLLWHPPYFRSSDFIKRSASSSGYATAERFLDPGDWLSRDEALRLGIRNASSAQIIEQIVEKKRNGAVIPVHLGLLPGGRDEYLFNSIEVLLDALIRCGSDIVPVSAVTYR